MDGPLWPLVVYFLAVVLLVGGMMFASSLLGGRRRSTMTETPFESGIEPVTDARLRISAKFYLVAIFFVVFDLEAVYLFAWSVAAREAGWPGFVEAAIFVLLLLAALAYLWRLGALDWSRSMRSPRRGDSP